MTDRRKVKQLMKVWIAIIGIVVIGGYAAFMSRNLSEGPQIAVSYPQNGETVHDSVVYVSGTAKNVSFLSLNGNKIFTDESGTYKEKILVSPGYNNVTLEARDRFGRTARQTLQLTFN